MSSCRCNFLLITRDAELARRLAASLAVAGGEQPVWSPVWSNSADPLADHPVIDLRNSTALEIAAWAARLSAAPAALAIVAGGGVWQAVAAMRAGVLLGL